MARFRALFGNKAMRNKAADSTALHLELGRKGENAAENYLVACGYKILARNWRHSHLELDLVCRDKEYLVFVEVKTRQNADFGGPEGAITAAKKRRLAKCALFWLKEHDAWNIPARFDVVCLTACGKTYHLEHYRNAFDFSPSLGNRGKTKYLSVRLVLENQTEERG